MLFCPGRNQLPSGGRKKSAKFVWRASLILKQENVRRKCQGNSVLGLNHPQGTLSEKWASFAAFFRAQLTANLSQLRQCGATFGECWTCTGSRRRIYWCAPWRDSVSSAPRTAALHVEHRRDALEQWPLQVSYKGKNWVWQNPWITTASWYIIFPLDAKHSGVENITCCHKAPKQKVSQNKDKGVISRCLFSVKLKVCKQQEKKSRLRKFSTWGRSLLC